MKAILMNKNIPVFMVDYDNKGHYFRKILENYNEEFAPIHWLKRDCSIIQVDELTKWFTNRGIPSYRDGLKELLEALQISNQKDLLNMSFGLSLSDQYWLKPQGVELEWKDINFFTNKFDSADFTNATFNRSSIKKPINFITPNNTTNGMHSKSWVINNDEKRMLLKGGYAPHFQEPFNEVLATMLAERAGFEHVPYQVVIVNKMPVCSCECMINENEEIITASYLVKTEKRPYHLSLYNHYIYILEGLGLKDARSKLEQMLIIDYLTMNTDRHMNNFGVIRNVETLQIERVCPIFDTGQSMNINKGYNLDFVNGVGKFFEHTEKSFESQLDEIEDLTVYANLDFSDIPDKWGNILKEYQEFNKLPDNVISELVEGIETRIEKFNMRVNEAIR